MGWRGSYTIEAAVVMGVFCFLAVNLLQHVYRLHDETAGKMTLHEMVEKAACEVQKTAAENEGGIMKALEDKGEDRMKHAFSFNGFQILLKDGTKGVCGTAEGDIEGKLWNSQIEVEFFRPEDFMRKTEAVKQLGDKDGNSL